MSNNKACALFSFRALVARQERNGPERLPSNPSDQGWNHHWAGLHPTDGATGFNVPFWFTDRVIMQNMDMPPPCQPESATATFG